MNSKLWLYERMEIQDKDVTGDRSGRLDCGKKF